MNSTYPPIWNSSSYQVVQSVVNTHHLAMGVFMCRLIIPIASVALCFVVPLFIALGVVPQSILLGLAVIVISTAWCLFIAIAAKRRVGTALPRVITVGQSAITVSTPSATETCSWCDCNWF